MLWREMLPIHGKLLQRTWQIGLRNLSITKSLMKNHYEVLGISKDATQADIKNAYFELSKIYHPDRIAATDENLEKFREITAAYEVLGNEQSRRLYDGGLLGEEKKLGVDEPEDLTDPIIKFYKERQRQKRAPTIRVKEDLDHWTQEFYKKARKQAAAKNQLFSAIYTSDESNEPYRDHIFMLCVAAVFGILYNLDMEGHPIQVFAENVIKYLKSDK